jgi:hypothetical protein
VTIPPSIVFLDNAQQTGLPVGWTILSNTGTQLRLCNSGDAIPGTSQRDIILKVQGVNIAPPQTFAGQINFGNGTTCAAGTSVAGNNTADDFATSTIEVIAGTVPLTLLSFNATLLNCQPSLKWTTENEINAARIEVERASENSSTWILAGVTEARGKPGSKTDYSLTDNSLNTSSATKQLYRLKLIDKDGKFTYSDILPVSINCKTVQLSVFPNPVQNGKLYVSLTGTSGQAEAILMSVTGQAILKTKINNGTQFLNVVNVPDGTYILNVRDANGIVEKAKVIIQK